MSVSLDFLDQYQEEFTPVTGNQFPSLEDIPDGSYDCTFMSAIVATSKGQNPQPIVKCMIRFDSIDKQAEKPYWLSSQENVNRLAGDLKTLGFDVEKWKKNCKLSVEITKAVAQLPGMRFKGTKKTNKPKNQQGKEFHNLYVNAGLTPSADAAQLVKANEELQAAAGGSGGDYVPF